MEEKEVSEEAKEATKETTEAKDTSEEVEFEENPWTVICDNSEITEEDRRLPNGEILDHLPYEFMLTQPPVINIVTIVDYYKKGDKLVFVLDDNRKIEKQLTKKADTNE